MKLPFNKPKLSSVQEMFEDFYKKLNQIQAERNIEIQKNQDEIYSLNEEISFRESDNLVHSRELDRVANLQITLNKLIGN